MSEKLSGPDPAFVPAASSPAVSTEGFNPGQWQPIETAPKAGKILGFMPNKPNPPYQAVIYWDEQFRSEGWDEEADDVMYFGAWCAGRVGSFQYEEYAEERPTHWMPLPPPPQP